MYHMRARNLCTDTSNCSARRVAEFVRKEYGKLDILVNNAAVCFNDPTLYGKVWLICMCVYVCMYVCMYG